MQIVAQYEALKHAFAERLALTDPECHVHAGLFIYLVVALALRRPLSSPLPLIAVAVAEAINEAMDWLSAGMVFPPDALSDVIRTLLWPLAIFTAANILRRP